ncbi:MAG: hypothetical protein U1E53_20645 [Dongiaceae bacterium]
MKRLLPLVAMLCLAGCEDLGLEDPVPTDQTAAPTTASSSLSQPPAAALMPAPSADQAAPAEPSGAETAMAAPPPPPPGDRTCADFLFYKDGQSGVSSVIADPFTIATSADGSGEPLEIHDASLDMGVQGGMSVRIADKVFIIVDQPSPRYEVYYISAGENPIKLQVFGADGKLEQTHILSAFPQKQLLMQPIASQQGLRAIVLTDPDKTGLLTKVCAVK